MKSSAQKIGSMVPGDRSQENNSDAGHRAAPPIRNALERRGAGSVIVSDFSYFYAKSFPMKFTILSLLLLSLAACKERGNEPDIDPRSVEYNNRAIKKYNVSSTKACLIPPLSHRPERLPTRRGSSSERSWTVASGCWIRL